MILYHTTTLEWALAILQTGFQDGAGSYGFECHELRGVFLASEPVSVNEGAQGDAVLRVDLDVTEQELAAWEIIEGGKWFREFVIPAERINGTAAAVLIDEGDIGPEWLLPDP